MRTKPEIHVDIRPIEIESAVVHAPFDEALETLTENGYDVISLKQNAQLRILQGKDSHISRNGNWTREGFVYIPSKGIYLTKNSPIMENAGEATQAHRNKKHYFLTNEQVKQALSDSVQIPKNVRQIPTNRFGENEITTYAFGDVAEQYGKFLKGAGIEEMPTWLYDLQDKPFATQLWFGVLDYWSFLYVTYRFLDNDYGLRGVKMGAK